MSEVIGIGAAPRRKEDLRFLTGRGNYVADIQRPAMVAGVFVRSPHAHAEIKSIDTSAALWYRVRQQMLPSSQGIVNCPKH